MTRWLPTLFLAFALAAPLALSPAPTFAEDDMEDVIENQEGGESGQNSKTYWQSRYTELKGQVSSASARLTQAKREYSKAKQRDRLRGDSKNSILQQIQSAEMDLEDAQKALDALPDEARAAGAQPGWFREIDENYAG
ncbi:MAG: hypothetical protein JRG96_09560 [Deltaproteobacteria bacterium]|nr:hypothetical protein [Deltaproteobacteria bacterium]